MNYLDLLKASKAHTLSNCYTFINKEKYLYDHTLERVVSDYLSIDLLTFNYVNIDAATSSYDSVYNALITLPVMSDYKITVIENLEQMNLNDKERDQVVEMGLSSEDQICIFAFNNKKSKIYNLLKRKKVEIIEFTKLSDVNFKKWVNKKFTENGKKISAQALQFFTEYSLYNDRNQMISLYQIENEIKKIASLSKTMIEIDELKNTMIMPLEMNVFSLTDYLAKGDLKNSFEKLSELISKGHNEYELMPLLTKQYYNMLLGKALSLKGYSNDTIQEVLGFKSSYPVKMILTRTQKMSKKHLLDALEHCLTFESELKSKSVNKRAHIENLMLKLVQ